MHSENLEIKDEWDVVTTMAKLDELESMCMDFVSHTTGTMSRPSRGWFGEASYDENGNQLIEHPFGEIVNIIRSCKSGCYQKYGEHMYKQGKLFDVHFNEED